MHNSCACTLGMSDLMYDSSPRERNFYGALSGFTYWRQEFGTACMVFYVLFRGRRLDGGMPVSFLRLQNFVSILQIHPVLETVSLAFW